MAPTPAEAAAAAAGNAAETPMEVDDELLVVLKEIAVRGKLTLEDIRGYTRREPGEAMTTGDMTDLGQMIKEKVLTADKRLAARQLEAETDSTRRRAEMATETDHSDEYNELYNELFPLEACIPADHKHMGKQVSSLAAKLRERRRAGGLKMDSAGDWVHTRQELEETFRDARLGGNEMAKCWLAFEIASPATRSNMKDLNLIKELRESPALANYTKHFVQPQNHCYQVLSTSANARHSLYQQRPKQAPSEDVGAWHRRLVAMGTEGFGDISQWNREHRTVVTDCFIRRSRCTALLEMHVNRPQLEAASATSRADHLNSLSRLCGEKSLGHRDVHPLDNYHMTPADPVGTSATAASLPTDAPSEPKSQPWFKRGNRRPADRPPRTADRITWVKKDGRCATCNRDNDHPQPCTRPRVCWTCDSPDHSRADCPAAPARPHGGRGQPTGGKPRKPGVNHVQRQPGPPQQLMSPEEPVEGLYSIAPSQASTTAHLPCNIIVDFMAPPTGNLRSVRGVAGTWDTGCLTHQGVVMKTAFFLEWLGTETDIEPWESEVRVEGAGGHALTPRGTVRCKLAIGQLPALAPVDVKLMICDGLAPNFLIGRKAVEDWTFSVDRAPGNSDYWRAGGQSMKVLSSAEANEHNAGFFLASPADHEEWARNRCVTNPLRPEPEDRWTVVSLSLIHI